MRYHYKFKEYNKDNMARAVGLALPISTKHAVEICNFISGLKLKKAKEILNKVISLEQPIPFMRYNRDIGHKRGIAAGRYPVKASKEILKLLEDVEANAQFKGLNTSALIIKHISANKAAIQWHYGRRRRRRMKRTHIEVVVEETKK